MSTYTVTAQVRGYSGEVATVRHAIETDGTGPRSAIHAATAALTRINNDDKSTTVLSVTITDTTEGQESIVSTVADHAAECVTPTAPERWDGDSEGYGSCGVLGCEDCT